MLNILLITSGKLFSKLLQLLHLGNGSTWPGHIALKANKHFNKQLIKKNNHVKIVIIAGTNGKTTTAKLIRTILEDNGKKVIQNQSGANLLNGIASTLLLAANPLGNLPYDYALFEVDENALPPLLQEITPDYLMLLNLFRDQLDRYGEVRTIASKWKKAIEKLPERTTIILNADDPEVAYLGNEARHKHLFFGLKKKSSKKEHEHAVDSVYCPKCGNKLNYKNIYYSHLGEWECGKCGTKRPHIDVSDAPSYPLSGMYNIYNILAATIFTKTQSISKDTITSGLEKFTPAFGRQEKVTYHGKNIQIFLVKNPTGFNESIRTIKDLNAKTILLVLNDRYADGTDVSWIWDVDTEMLTDFAKYLIISGDRGEDMALRIKYSHATVDDSTVQYKVQTDLPTAITYALEKTEKNETLFILPTYTAMLEVREILTGKKIL